MLLRYTWTNYLGSHGIFITHNSEAAKLLDIAKAFMPSYATNLQNTIINNYIEYLFFKHHTSTYWFLAGLILVFSTYNIAKISDYKIPHFAYIGFYLCFTAYLFILLILYLFSFDEYEGVRIASATRYINTINLAMLIYFFGVFINVIQNISINKTKKIKISVVFLMLILPNSGRLIIDTIASYNQINTQKNAFEIEQLAKSVVSQTPEKSKIYFIWSNQSNDDSVIFNYAIYPRISNTSCSSIIPSESPSNENDPWSCRMNNEKFKQTISDYEYIFIAFSSKEFEQKYFQNYNSIDSAIGIFKINNENGRIRFIKI